MVDLQHGESDGRLMARGSAALAVAQTAARALAFGFVIVATHELAPNEFGRYSIVAALVLLVGIVADSGTTIAITKHVSTHPEDSDGLLSGTALMSVALGIAGYAAAMGFVIVAGYPQVTVVDMAIVGLGLPFDAVLTSVIGALDGRGRIVERAWISAGRVSLVAVGGALALLFGSGVRGPMVAIAATPPILLLATIPLARRWRVWWSRPRVDASRSRRLLIAAFPFAVVGVINVLILRFDVILVSLLTTRTETALYDLATRSIEGVAYLGAVIGVPLMVVLSRRLAAGDRIGSQKAFTDACRVSWLLGLGIAAVVAGTSQPIVHTFFGSAYDDAVIPLALLASQLPLLFITALQGTVLAAGTDERGLVWVSVLVGSATLLLDLAIVPIFEANGAAAVMIAIRVIAFLAFIYRMRRTMQIHTPGPAIGALVAALAAFVVGLLTSSLGIVVAVAAALATYVVLVLASRAMRISELREVRRILSSSSPVPPA